MTHDEFLQACSGLGLRKADVEPLGTDSTYPGFRIAVLGPHHIFCIDIPRERSLSYQRIFDMIEARVLGLESGAD